MRILKGFERNEPLLSSKEQNEKIKDFYDQLPEMDRRRIDDSVDALCRVIQDVGTQTAREILFALGKLMAEREHQNGRPK